MHIKDVRGFNNIHIYKCMSLTACISHIERYLPRFICASFEIRSAYFQVSTNHWSTYKKCEHCWFNPLEGTKTHENHIVGIQQSSNVLIDYFLIRNKNRRFLLPLECNSIYDISHDTKCKMKMDYIIRENN